MLPQPRRGLRLALGTARAELEK